MAILRRIFFRISFSNFWFLSLLLARSRRVLANLEERIQKFIDAAFFWPVENVPGTQRARARARARPSCSTGASGPFDDRRLRSTTFRARATFKKYILSLGSFFYFCVNYILFCLNCVQMFYNLFNFSRVFNLTLCVPPAKLRNLEKRRARHFLNFQFDPQGWCSGGHPLFFIVLLRFEANFEFQKCAVTSSSFRPYRV